MNEDWIARVLVNAGWTDVVQTQRRAHAIFAVIGGAQLVDRSCGV